MASSCGAGSTATRPPSASVPDVGAPAEVPTFWFVLRARDGVETWQMKTWIAAVYTTMGPGSIRERTWRLCGEIWDRTYLFEEC